MTASAFQSASGYPELSNILNNFNHICHEANLSYEKLVAVNDSRIHTNAWQVLPLKVEAEDKAVMNDALCQKNRSLAPVTCATLEAITSIKAYAFSILKPTGHILPHAHDNPYVTAMLCLKDGGEAFIRVNGQTQYFHEREIIVFDYTQLHEVKNNGTQDRIVLLMLMDNRRS